LKPRIRTLEKARDEFVADLSAALDGTLQAGLASVTPGKPGKRDKDIPDYLTEENLHSAWRDLHHHGRAWVSNTRKAWLDLLNRDEVAHSRFASLQLEIEDPQAVEHRIQASRLSAHFHEACTGEFADLRLRILHIESSPELSSFDVLQPSVFCLSWIESWTKAGLTDLTWETVGAVMHKAFIPALLQAYKKVNSTLIRERVLPTLDQHKIRKRNNLDSGSAPSGLHPAPGATGLAQQAAHFRQVAGLEQVPYAHHGWNDVLGMAGGGASFPTMPGFPQIGAPAGSPAAMPGTSPTAWVDPRTLAQNVTSRLGSLLTERIGFVSTAHDPPRPGQASERGFSETTLSDLPRIEPPPELLIPEGASPKQALDLLRQYSNDLKKQAFTQQDKAAIEIVALMFQSILSEERIAESIRLLFARLQIPVVRVALLEPRFFESLEHPARRMIDRMGSCALGLDAATVSAADLQAEIRRAVEVIEQYPETGSKAFEMMLGEFETFLQSHLGSGAPQRKVQDMARQIEKREAYTVQYTIEIRNLLQDVVLADVLRDFLLKFWSEVLAVCAVQHGRNDPHLEKYKRVISQLVWAGSPKPERSERMRMIAEMPALLELLREGMHLIRVPQALIETHIRALGDAFTDAFQTKTQSLAPERLAEISRQLHGLEDLFTDEQLRDLPIDTESLELMLDLDPQALAVITHQPEPPGEAVRMWVRNDMDLGQWFNLHTPNGLVLLQYAWRSDRRQLHLFSNPQGKTFLFVALSLAAHLQAQHLVPLEHEALTVRATRQALDRIQANPDQLLN